MPSSGRYATERDEPILGEDVMSIQESMSDGILPGRNA
jgi:hypothetical protein